MRCPLILAKARSVDEKSKYQWDRHLGEAYCGPLLARPVNTITTLDVMKVLSRVWHEQTRGRTQTAPRHLAGVRPRTHRPRGDDHGVALEHNPANWTDLKAAGLQKPVELSRGHHPSLAYVELPEFVAALRERDAVAARALEF